MKIQTKDDSSSQQRTKYDKIPLRSKIKLFKQVFQKGEPVRKVAEELHIKYSTAKTLIRQYKYQQISIDLNLYPDESSPQPHPKHKPKIRCGYRDVVSTQAQQQIRRTRGNVNRDEKESERRSQEKQAETIQVPIQNKIQIISRLLSQQ